MRNQIFSAVLILVCASSLSFGKSKKRVDPPEARATVTNIEEGQKVATDVLEGLRVKLTEQMAKNLVSSIEYCHEKAIVLTKDFTLKHPQVLEVKRTSLKLRNTVNKPDEREEKVLKDWQAIADKGQVLPPYFSESVSPNEFRYYKPLVVSAMCLSCHGQPAGDVAKAIHKKYPEDKATGYKEGEFRGVIRVSLKPITVTN